MPNRTREKKLLSETGQENVGRLQAPAMASGVTHGNQAFQAKGFEPETSDCRLSVIVPNRNGGRTIGQCLEALFASRHDSFEVIVVDDCSEDDSVAIIQVYPCRLIRLDRHVGAAAARNRGVADSHGEILFFTDADCLVLPDTLTRAEVAARRHGPGVAVGGTYTMRPADSGFFSLFQSVFIHHSELKHRVPDYLATHGLVIWAATFRENNGFKEDFLPILEDVEFSHRLRRNGCRLLMEPSLMVQHIFNYSLVDSLRNGFVKSRFWTIYSFCNRDILSDSGTASFELKLNVLIFYLLIVSALSAWVFLPGWPVLTAAVTLLLLNSFVSRDLFRLFFHTGGAGLVIQAGLYYMFAYPLVIGAGSLVGLSSTVLAGGKIIRNRP